ncbi:MAG TPA: sigma-70 family RNA polymerase sigma factor [Gemmataceae bacterium]|nr:sigma-70 family RNA polymerase sigma factor [Gemmataceae bacterium]
MEPTPSSSTRVSLLVRIQNDPTDQAAWGEFVQRYGPKIYAWTRQRGLQESDAEDVTQNVLLKLASKLRTFAYDPTLSFRGWLHTITQNALSDFVSERRRPGEGSGDSGVLAMLGTLEARADLESQLSDAFDRELLEEAMARVQGRVAAHRWLAFQLTTVEGLSGAEAGARLQMKVASVYTAKNQIHKMVQEEIQKLEQGSR